MAKRRRGPLDWSLKIQHPLFIGPKLPARVRAKLKKRREMEAKKPRPPWHKDFIGPVIPIKIRRARRQKQWRLRNIEKAYAQCRAWAKNNPHKLKAIRHGYYCRNKAKFLEDSKKRKIKRYHQDPEYRFVQRLRGRILRAVKEQYTEKAFSSIKLLGADIQTVRNHLAAHFKPGMSWENHGINGWHIDHVIPCAAFDLADPQQQLMCFHYTNLRPMWAGENLLKSDSITREAIELVASKGVEDEVWQNALVCVDGLSVFEPNASSSVPRQSHP